MRRMRKSPSWEGVALGLAFGCFGCSTAVVAPAAPPSQRAAEAPVAAAAPSGPPKTIMLDGGCDNAKVAYLDECQRNPASCRDAERTAGAVSYGAILNRGDYLDACKSPPSVAVRVCAAIRAGHAVAVTVTTTPGVEALSTCIGKAVQAIQFPSSAGLDVASTVFEAQ
jgi:eukaryotic-like serine/threonine-protein kinase